MQMKAVIGLTYDLRDDYIAAGMGPEQAAEFDSRETIDLLERAIASLGYRTDRIGHAKALAGRLVKADQWDLVFNIAEGVSGRGRESQVPCLLELYGIPYTFSDPLVCATTLDKAVAKRLVRAAGLHTADYALVVEPDDCRNVNLQYPLFVKPLAEGTSKGIDGRSRIGSPGQLHKTCQALLEQFRQPVLVEEYLPGREFTVGLLGGGPDARVLGIMEVAMRHGGELIYSYETKERCEELINYTRASDDPLAPALREMALGAYRALELRDGGRVDLRCDRAGRPCFIEANPLPGLHPTHSDLPMIATQEGMDYPTLLGSIIDAAWSRHGGKP
ncbi:MAG: D-alanine--D-alanine ligase [Gemmatimonadales bacterium]|nr:MAG: D-alanine--D-alanine ligase [Gemmatimonadales bacterium]